MRLCPRSLPESLNGEMGAKRCLGKNIDSGGVLLEGNRRGVAGGGRLVGGVRAYGKLATG
jgi:hypothetical protein